MCNPYARKWFAIEQPLITVQSVYDADGQHPVDG